jgi:hypothetical protein
MFAESRRKRRVRRWDPNEIIRGYPECGAITRPRVAGCAILFHQTCELDPIEPGPVRLEAGEKLKFAACEDRHETGNVEIEQEVGLIAKHHYFFCIPAYRVPLYGPT